MTFTKKCSKCAQVKEARFFSPRKTCRDGLNSWCKKCNSLNGSLYNKSPVSAEKAKQYRKQSAQARKEKAKLLGVGIRALRLLGAEKVALVYDRAGRACEICRSENDLTIHHKDRQGRNHEERGLKQNNEIHNLELLCRKCHGAIHGRQSREGKLERSVRI